MLTVQKSFREAGKDYAPGDAVPKGWRPAVIELLRRRGWVGEGTPGAQAVTLEVRENPAEIDARWIAPGESNAEREQRLRNQERVL